MELILICRSFIFQFQSLLTGPLVFFKEYREFIFHDHSPSPASVVFKKLVGSIFCAILYLKVAPQFDMDYLKGSKTIQLEMNHDVTHFFPYRGRFSREYIIRVQIVLH
jgi:hypothetical protein